MKKIITLFFSFFKRKNSNSNKYNIEVPKGKPIITKEFLINTPEDLRQQEIFYHICDYQLKNDIKEEYEKVSQMKKGHQLIWVLWHLDGEINNGGYYQFFDNFENCNLITTEYYSLITNFLKLINCDNFAKDFSKALSIYHKFQNCKNSEKENKLSSKLEQLDQNFYQNEDKLINAINIYIKNNLDEFIS